MSLPGFYDHRMAIDAAEAMNLCACGCGTEVAGTWARGHAKRGRAELRVEPLTDEEIDGAADGWADLGEISIDPEPDEVSVSGGAAGPSRNVSPGPPPSEPDQPPAHATKDRRKAARASKPRAAAVRVTAGIRADIHAKISMPLEIAGQIWNVRDPACGGAFLTQRPAIADALADIVIDSPDLVNFFMGPAGGFMKYLNLGAALWPVAEMVAAHHVWHTVEVAPVEEGAGQVPAYAA